MKWIWTTLNNSQMHPHLPLSTGQDCWLDWCTTIKSLITGPRLPNRDEAVVLSIVYCCSTYSLLWKGSRAHNKAFTLVSTFYCQLTLHITAASLPNQSVSLLQNTLSLAPSNFAFVAGKRAAPAASAPTDFCRTLPCTGGSIHTRFHTPHTIPSIRFPGYVYLKQLALRTLVESRRVLPRG